MTPTTFRALREHLGLPAAYAAGALGVSTRTLSRWEHADTRLPIYASEWLQNWVDLTEAQIAWNTAHAQNGGTLCLHSSAGEYAQAHRSGILDHQWWNRSMARIAAVTGAELEYEACQKPDKPRPAMAPACDVDVE